ncbi:hypothetical protein DL96DRAFT_1826947 [Flagelloscypha sp. PMI_526]|nr:hypothetical protein DL96DRAFT_1826947 [Flagelloscypha sp. PMI_526]
MSITSLPELPAEIQGQILQKAAGELLAAEYTPLMLVSRMAYNSVTYIAYKSITITKIGSFRAFLLFVKTKGISFIASRLRGLHLHVSFGSDAFTLWSELFASVIPSLVNLRYFEAWGSFGNPPQATAVRQALLLTLPNLPNLTYFGANTTILADNCSAPFRLFQSVTHLKRFNPDTPVESILHLLKSFPNLTHFMTPISSGAFSEKVTALAERLSHMKVIILACYGISHSYDSKPFLTRFPNLVFKDITQVFNRSDVPRFREIAEESGKDFWLLAEEELARRKGGPTFVSRK